MLKRIIGLAFMVALTAASAQAWTWTSYIEGGDCEQPYGEQIWFDCSAVGLPTFEGNCSWECVQTGENQVSFWCSHFGLFCEPACDCTCQIEVPTGCILNGENGEDPNRIP